MPEIELTGIVLQLRDSRTSAENEADLFGPDAHPLRRSNVAPREEKIVSRHRPARELQKNVHVVVPAAGGLRDHHVHDGQRGHKATSREMTHESALFWCHPCPRLDQRFSRINPLGEDDRPEITMGLGGQPAQDTTSLLSPCPTPTTGAKPMPTATGTNRLPCRTGHDDIPEATHRVAKSSLFTAFFEEALRHMLAETQRGPMENPLPRRRVRYEVEGPSGSFAQANGHVAIVEYRF